jgi:hypothetical protein
VGLHYRLGVLRDENATERNPTRLNRGLSSYVRRMLVAEADTVKAITFPALVWYHAPGSEEEVNGWMGTMTGAFLARPRAEEPVVLELRKANRRVNPFAMGITIGRADTNDMVISDGSISRFHAYFVEVKGQWALVDAESKNGTWSGAQRLEPNTPAPIADKSRLRFGSVEVEFYLPGSFVTYVRQQIGTTTR